MSSLSRNSCAKAFGNWSRGKNFRPKIPRGASLTSPPPPLPVLGLNGTHEFSELVLARMVPLMDLSHSVLLFHNQNWFWPEWPYSWIRTAQFSRFSWAERAFFCLKAFAKRVGTVTVCDWPAMSICTGQYQYFSTGQIVFFLN